MKRRKLCSAILVILLLLPVLAHAQLDQYQDVNFFNNRHMDANQGTTRYAEGRFNHQYNGVRQSQLGATAAMPLGNFEIALDWFYYFFCYDSGKNYNGISDPAVYGKYNIMKNDKMSVSAGAYVTLPIGSEKVWAGDLDFGFWGAMRYMTCCEWLVRGYFGLGFYPVTEYTYVDMAYKEKETYHNNYYFGAGGMKKVATNIYASVDAGMTFNGTTSLTTTAGVEYHHKNMAFRGAAGFNRHGSSSMWTNAGLFQFGVRVNF